MTKQEDIIEQLRQENETLKKKLEILQQAELLAQEAKGRLEKRNKALESEINASKESDQATATAMAAAVETSNNMEARMATVSKQGVTSIQDKKAENFQQSTSNNSDTLTRKVKASINNSQAKLISEGQKRIAEQKTHIQKLTQDLDTKIQALDSAKQELRNVIARKDGELQALTLKLKTTIEQTSREIKTNSERFAEKETELNNIISRITRERDDIEKQLDNATKNLEKSQKILIAINDELKDTAKKLDESSERNTRLSKERTAQAKSFEAKIAHILMLFDNKCKEAAEYQKTLEEIEATAEQTSTEQFRTPERVRSGSFASNVGTVQRKLNV